MHSGQVRLLDWDSNFFGFQVAELKLEADATDLPAELVAGLCEKGVRLAYVHANAKLADDSLFSVFDERLEYRLNISGLCAAPRFASSVQSWCSQVPVQGLEQLAVQAGQLSRFMRDPNLDRSRVRDLYRVWLRHALNTLEGPMVRVVSRDGAACGMVSLQHDAVGQYRIGLIAVSPGFQRQGYGRALCCSALMWAQDHGVQGLQVRTQRINSAACRLYESMGGDLVRRSFLYHLWL